MVGLSIVLESSKEIGSGEKKSSPGGGTQIISKASMTMIKQQISPSSPNPLGGRRNPFSNLVSTAAGFLDRCFLCRQKLLPGKDIFMYKGDRAFCSVECRCRQIFMDEDEDQNLNINMSHVNPKTRDNCAMAAIRPQQSAASASSSSSSPSPQGRKGSRNRPNGFVVY